MAYEEEFIKNNEVERLSDVQQKKFKQLSDVIFSKFEIAKMDKNSMIETEDKIAKLNEKIKEKTGGRADLNSFVLGRKLSGGNLDIPLPFDFVDDSGHGLIETFINKIL